MKKAFITGISGQDGSGNQAPSFGAHDGMVWAGTITVQVS